MVKSKEIGPSKPSFRPSKATIAIAIISIIFSNIGSYYNYDIAQILNDNFTIKFKVKANDVLELYTVYYLFSFPLTILGGFMIHKFGAVTSVVLLTFIIFLGSISSLYACTSGNFAFIWIGRALDGFAAEVNDIAINTVISIWFKGRSMSMVMTLAQFSNSLSASISDFSGVRLFQYTRSIADIYTVAGFISGFSSICTLVFQFLEFKREKFLKKVGTEEGNEEKELNFTMIKSLNNMQIWGMILTASISDAVYYCFSSFTTELLTKRFRFTLLGSSNFMLLLPITSMVCAPIFGWLTVKFGRKMSLLTIAYILTCASLILLFFLPYTPTPLVAIPLAMIGIFKGVNGAFIWSGIALVTPENSVPLAFCIAELSSNLSTSLVSFIFGGVIEGEKKENFQFLILFMLIFCILGMIATIYTYIKDQSRGGILELPENGNKSIRIKMIVDYEENDRERIMEFLSVFTSKNHDTLMVQSNYIDDEK